MVEQDIINLILHYKYFIVFPLAVLEGPAVSIILGFLVSLNYFHFGAALAVLVLADLFGDTLYYLIGKYAGPIFINRFGKYVGLSFERVSKIQNYVLENSYKTIVFGKIVHSLGIPTLISVGMSKVPLRSFLLMAGSVALVKSIILLLLGYLFGNVFRTLIVYLDRFSSLTIVLGILIVLFLIWKKFWSGAPKVYV